MAASIDYSKWDKYDDEPEQDSERQSTDDARNLKIMLSKLHLKATEMFDRAMCGEISCIQQAEESYREILRYIEMSSSEIVNLLDEKEKELYFRSSLNLASCLHKQDRYEHVLEVLDALSSKLRDEYSSYTIPVEDEVRMKYLIAYSMLKTCKGDLVKFSEVQSLSREMQDSLQGLPFRTNPIMEDYQQLFADIASLHPQILNSSLRTSRAQLRSILPTVMDLMKKSSYRQAEDALLALKFTHYTDEEEVVIYNSHILATVALIRVAGGQLMEALQQTEDCTRGLDRFMRSLSCPAAIALGVTLVIQWRAIAKLEAQLMKEEQQSVAGVKEACTRCVQRTGQYLAALEASACTELAQRPLSLIWQAAPCGIGEVAGVVDAPESVASILLKLYESLSGYYRDRHDWRRCYDILTRSLQLSSLALHLYSTSTAASQASHSESILMLRRARSMTLFCLGTVAVQLGEVLKDLRAGHYLNPFKAVSSYDPVEEFAMSALEKASQADLFACHFLEAAASAALECDHHTLALRASRQCGDLLLSHYRITPFRVNVKIDGAERCHDIWRMAAKALTKLISKAPASAQALQWRVDLVVALYQAGLSALVGMGLQEEALRALESAAEARAEIEAEQQDDRHSTTLSADFWLVSGDLSFHLAHVYLRSGKKNYLSEEIARTERYYARDYLRAGGEQVTADERLRHLCLLRAWALVAERKVDAAEAMLESLSSSSSVVGPIPSSAGTTGELAEIRQRIAAIRSEEAKPTPIVSSGRGSPTENDEIAKPTNIRMEPLPVKVSSPQSWDFDLLIAYGVLLAIGAALLAMYWRMSPGT